MPFKFFTVPIQDQGQGEAALNAFLRSHRVLGVDRSCVLQGASSFWMFCIDYLDGPAPGAPGGGRPAHAKPKVDYRETLTPEDFAVFSKLREVRKALAAEESVPVWTIFNNEQLAQMVLTRATGRAALEKIEGVGEARIAKYAGRFLEALEGAWKADDEASRPAV